MALPPEEVIPAKLVLRIEQKRLLKFLLCLIDLPLAEFNPTEQCMQARLRGSQRECLAV